MTRRVRIGLASGLATFALASLGAYLSLRLWGRRRPPPQPRAAALRILKAGDTRTISFEYGRDLIDIYTMFPACRTCPSGTSPPSWEPGYEAVFEYENDPTVRLLVSADGRLWTRGRGDFAVNGDLELFLQALPTTELMRLLRSQDETERAEGERRLAEDGAALMELLMASVKTGVFWQQREASRRLRFFVSPWVRNVEWGGVGAFSFRRVDRNVQRPVWQPTAAELRKVCLDALQDLLAQCHEKARQSEQRGGYYWNSGMMGTFGDVTQLLGEVGNDAVIDELAQMLPAEADLYLVPKLMACVDLMCGLPPSFDPRPVCPCGMSESQMDAHRAEEVARLREARDSLLDWLNSHRADSREDRTRAALSKWDGRLVDEHGWKSGPGFSATVGRLAPIIRMGRPALPMLREKQAMAADLAEKGYWELVIAYVTGEADAALVRELLDGETRLKILACQLIAAAESREWEEDLDRLQYERAYVYCESVVQAASEALAVCHREEALPLLRRALKRHEWNLVAKTAVEVLEQRARAGRRPEEGTTDRR